MRILVIGGTVFVGRAVVDDALARGHEVVVFHRGEHGEDAVPDVEHVHGDRIRDLGLVAGRGWDAVVDTCGFDEAHASTATEALGEVGHYSFVSSISAYLDWPTVVVDESSAVKAVDHEDAYGAGKVAAERRLAATFGPRLHVTRPGLIVGPHENIGRLPYWLRRTARGGRVLAPGAPGDARQWVDARDLAAFMVSAAERGVTGVHNIVTTPGAMTMGEILDACVAVTGGDAQLVWTDAAAIRAAGIEPWTELPIWLDEPGEESEHTWDADSTAAYAAGFAARSVHDTVADTWAWLQTGRDDSDGYRSDFAVTDLDEAKEHAALA